MHKSLVLACALLAATGGTAQAQEAPFSAARVFLRGIELPLLSAPRSGFQPSLSLLSESARDELSRARREPRGLRRAMHFLGGGLVGAGIGYLASQVVYSDWNKDHDGAFADRRMSYALTGAVLGGAGGFLVGGGGGGPAFRDASSSTSTESAAERRRVILREEMEQTVAATVLDLVQSLRPEWLVVRGIQRFREGGTVNLDSRGQGNAVPGEATIIVYLDNGRLGGLETLRQIPASNAASITFLDGPAAQYRFGRGHTHGAIVVSTATAMP